MKKWTLPLVLGLLFVVSSSCFFSGNTSDLVKVSLVIPPREQWSGGGRHSDAVTALGDLDCIAINVVGPGIPSFDSRYRPADPVATAQGTSHCTYPGVSTGFIPLSGSTPTTVELLIPRGSPRLIQVAGIDITGSTCPTGFNFSELWKDKVDNSSSHPEVGDTFEIGRALVNLSPNAKDMQVDIQGQFDSTREFDSTICPPGSSSGNSGTGGPPTFGGHLAYWLNAASYGAANKTLTTSDPWLFSTPPMIAALRNITQLPLAPGLGSTQYEIANGTTGKPAILFGSGDAFANSAGALLPSTINGFSVYVVADFDTDNAGTLLCMKGGTGGCVSVGTYAKIELLLAPPNTFKAQYGSSANLYNVGANTAGWHIHEMHWTSGAGNFEYGISGYTLTAVTNLETSPLTIDNPNSLFAIGADNTSGGNFTGRVAEVLFYDTMLDDNAGASQRDQARQYLINKYPGLRDTP